MPWRLEDLQLEVADRNAIALPHLARDLDRLEAVVRGVEPGRLGHVERNGSLVSRPQRGRGTDGRHHLDPEALAKVAPRRRHGPCDSGSR